MFSCQVIRRVILSSTPIAAIAIAGPAAGQSWIGGGTAANPTTGAGGWANNANWMPAPAVAIPSANTTALTFASGAGNPAYTANNNQAANPFLLNSLTLANANIGNPPVINGTPLSFQINPAGPITPTLNITANGPFNVSNDIVVTGTVLTVGGAGNGVVNLNGRISGTGSLNVASGGSGGIILNGNNNYAGGTILDSGRLVLGHATSPLGTGTVTLTGGQISTTINGSNVTCGNAFEITGDVIFGGVGVNTTLNITGGTTLTGVRNITVAHTFAPTTAAVALGTVGQSAAGAGITKLGNAGLQINENSTYTGPTTINAGALIHKGSLGAVANRTGKVTVDGNNARLITGGVDRKLYTVDVIQTKNGSTWRIGRSPATFEVDGPGVTLDPGTYLDMSIDGSTPGNDPGNHSQLTLAASNPFSNGVLDITDSTLIADLTYAPSNSDRIFLIANDNTDPIIGQFTQGGTITLQSSADSLFYQFDISYSGDWQGSPGISPVTGGNDLVLYNATVVPEPGALMLAGLGVLVLKRRRK